MWQFGAGRNSPDKRQDLNPTEGPTGRPQASENQRQLEVNRCRSEIAAIETLLRAGHPDVAGLCLALSDWSAELRILEAQSGSPSDCDSDVCA